MSMFLEAPTRVGRNADVQEFIAIVVEAIEDMTTLTDGAHAAVFPRRICSRAKSASTTAIASSVAVASPGAVHLASSPADGVVRRWSVSALSARRSARCASCWAWRRSRPMSSASWSILSLSCGVVVMARSSVPCVPALGWPYGSRGQVKDQRPSSTAS
jgi:hypothetical protein